MHHRHALFLSQTADGHERSGGSPPMLDISILLAA